MKPTEKFTKTLNGEQPPTSKVGSGNNNANAQHTNQSTPQQEHRIVLLEKVWGEIRWAYGRLDKDNTISNN